MDPPTRRALVIGIDNYLFDEAKPHQQYNNLAGCVNDVDSMVTFLESIGVTDIRKLTAPSKVEDRAKIDQNDLPTYANIIRHLDKLSSDCQRGDLIYIHYSGHGILRKKMMPDDGGDNLMGTALVPTDALTSRKYLTGYQLGVRVLKMVMVQGGRVCVTLDSCFSGGGFRNSDSEVHITPRGVEMVGEEADTMMEGDTAAADIASKLPLDTRDVKFTTNWFANPTKCSIITACGSKQVAGESYLSGSDFKQGVLTHWMLELLKKRNSPHLPFPTYARIREHVHLRTITSDGRASQTPSVRGDGDVEFFGDKVLVERPVSRVLTSSKNDVILDVGSVQGVAKGAVYDVHRQEDTTDGGLSTLPIAQVRVTTALPFQSRAVFIKRTGSPDTPPIAAGSRAILRTWALPRPFGVQFLCSDPEIQTHFLNEISKTPNLTLAADPTRSASLVVSINTHGDFEIQEKGVRLQRLPIIQQNAPDAVQKIAYVVRHVARYRAIEGILNHPRTSHLRHKDFVSTLRRHKVSAASHQVDDWMMDEEDEDQLETLVPDEDGRYRTHAKESVRYNFSYHGSFNILWMAMFGLSPSWAIRKMYPGKGQNAEEIWPAECEPDPNPLALDIKLTIPPKSVNTDSDDIVDKIIIFVASGSDSHGEPIPAPCWDELALPPLPNDSSTLPLDEIVESRATDEDSSRGEGGVEVTKVQGPQKIFWYSTSFEFHTFPDKSVKTGED